MFYQVIEECIEQNLIIIEIVFIQQTKFSHVLLLKSCTEKYEQYTNNKYSNNKYELQIFSSAHKSNYKNTY